MCLDKRIAAAAFTSQMRVVAEIFYQRRDATAIFYQRIVDVAILIRAEMRCCDFTQRRGVPLRFYS